MVPQTRNFNAQNPNEIPRFGEMILHNSMPHCLVHRALEESMKLMSGPGSNGPVADEADPAAPEQQSNPHNDDDNQLRVAMEMSRRQQEEDEKRRKQEEEELEMILKLSLTDK